MTIILPVSAHELDYVEVPDFDNAVQEELNSTSISYAKDIIPGTVKFIDKDKGFVCVDVGLKSEGLIPLSEFFHKGEKESLEVGSVIDVFLTKLDTKDGGVEISRAKAIRERSWRRLVAAKENDEVVEGIAFSRVKGGVSVDFDGVIAFLPGSQVDVRPVKDISSIVGKVVGYKVLSIEMKGKSVIVSRKAILELEKKGDRDKFLAGVNEGDIIEGVVKNITNYGAFVDLGDVDGLLHVTDIVWEKISHPSEILSVGQKVSVKVIKYDEESGRLSLGMKQLMANPWDEIKDEYQIGTVVKGKIINITTYGVFVRLNHGIEGLLHISEMSWTKDAYKKYKAMKLDQELEVVILGIDMEKHRIALSMRKMVANPWEKFAEDYKIGQVLDGVVRNVTDFGVFVGLDGVDVDGLVHVSDLAWGGDSMAEISKYNKGDPIKVVYLGSDLANQRIRFSVKQLTEDPFESHRGNIVKDAIVTCKIVGIKPDGIEVEIFDAIRSFIKKANLAKEKSEQRSERFVVGDRIDAKIVQCDDDGRKIVLSVRAQEESDHAKTLEKYGSANTGATIGSILGEAISNAAEKSEE